MASSRRSSTRPSGTPASESGTMNPIFAHDALPVTFSKHLRAPISGKFTPANRSTRASSMASSKMFTSQNSSDSGPSDSDSDHSEFRASDEGGSTVAPSTASKATRASSIKIPGGRAAIAKKVNPDYLDSDDELIKSMKEQGYRDEVIQERLVKEDRIIYNVKSIATRYGRICRTLAAAKTAKLDDDQTDWHDGDDDVLDDAIQENLYWYNRDLEILNRKYWYAVAEDSEKKMGKARFSKNACRERYEARQKGTAEPTLEADPDQHVRMARRIRWAAERQQRKNEAAAQEQAKEQAKLNKTEAARRKQEEKQLARAEKLAEQEERRRIKRQQEEERKANKEAEIQAKLVLKEAEEQKRVEKVERQKQEQLKRQQKKERQKKRREKERRCKEAQAAKSLVEKQENQLAEARKKLDDLENDKVMSEIVFSNMREEIGLSDEDEDDGNVSDVDTPPRKKSRLFPESKKERAGTTHGTPDKTALKSISMSCRQSVGTQKLRNIARARKLLTKGAKEDLVTRLAEADVSLRLAELQSLLKARGLSRTGRKVDLIRRLAMADAGEEVNRRKNPTIRIPKKRTNSEMDESAGSRSDNEVENADETELDTKEASEANDDSEAEKESVSDSGEGAEEDDGSEADDESSDGEDAESNDEAADNDGEDVEMEGKVAAEDAAHDAAHDAADDGASINMDEADGKEVDKAAPQGAKHLRSTPGGKTAYDEIEGSDDNEDPEDEDGGVQVDNGDHSVQNGYLQDVGDDSDDVYA
ncbi:MAG: hypothetical protein M1831_000825 [Alyxoria varia]|nr:MAG: hypothetical protein M1831_000825 [Alyxoria varia]